MYCSNCGNNIKEYKIICEKCGKKATINKHAYVVSAILIIGSFLYGLLFFLGIRYDFGVNYAILSFTLINLIFCIYANLNHLDISFKNLYSHISPIVALLIYFIPSAIYLIFIFITPSPECQAECLNNIGYGFGWIMAPIFSIVCYVPILIERIIIAFKKQKYTIHIFIVILFLILILDTIMSIGTPIKTNNLEDTLDFDVISIRYDSEKKIPILSDERIKYYAKYEIGYGVVYYFLLKPGIYSIEGVSYGWFDYLYKNRFNKTGSLFSRTTDKNILINETRNDNYIYRYSINMQGDYLLSGERIDIYQEDSEREKRRFELNQDYLLLVFKSGLEEGIEIEKLD